jgi:hypothetical protein
MDQVVPYLPSTYEAQYHKNRTKITTLKKMAKNFPNFAKDINM